MLIMVVMVGSLHVEFELNMSFNMVRIGLIWTCMKESKKAPSCIQLIVYLGRSLLEGEKYDAQNLKHPGTCAKKAMV